MIFVWLLITFIVGVAYWIGLPYYWELHKGLATALVILGNWILVNVLFHYYMALITPPGHPPDVSHYIIFLITWLDGFILLLP